MGRGRVRTTHQFMTWSPLLECVHPHPVLSSESEYLRDTGVSLWSQAQPLTLHTSWATIWSPFCCRLKVSAPGEPLASWHTPLLLPRDSLPLVQPWEREDKVASIGKLLSSSLSPALPPPRSLLQHPIPSKRSTTSLCIAAMAHVWRQPPTALNTSFSAEGVFIAILVMARFELLLQWRQHHTFWK